MFQAQNQYPLSLTSSIRNQMISHLQNYKSHTYVYTADVSNRQKVKRQLHFLTLPDYLYQLSKLRLTVHTIWLLHTEQEVVQSITFYRKLLNYTISDFNYKENMNMFRYVVIKYGYQFKSDYLIRFQYARYLRLFYNLYEYISKRRIYLYIYCVVLVNVGIADRKSFYTYSRKQLEGSNIVLI